LAFELDHAPGRERGEIRLHLSGQAPALDAGHSGQHVVESELTPVLANEI
jgi:hypothetical protein